MNIISASGITCYVENLEKTANFYEALGFCISEKDEYHVVASIDQFWIDFWPIDKASKPEFVNEAKLSNKGAGMFLYVHVNDVDDFYKDTIINGLEASTEPTNQPWGNREFVIRDPDGYKIVVYKKHFEPEEVVVKDTLQSLAL